MAKDQPNGAAKEEASFPEFTERKLRGYIFKFPSRYLPGHVLTREDALFFNSARASMIASSFSDRLAAMIDPNRTEKQEDGTEKKIGKATDTEVYNAFNAYEENYVYSPRGDGATLDPLEAEIRKIARNQLTLGLRAKGRTLQGLDKEAQDAAINLFIDKNRPALEKTAKKNLNDAASLLSDDILSQIGAREMKKSAGEEASA